MSFLLILLSGCEKNTDEDSNLDPIEDEYAAEDIVRLGADNIVSKVLDELSGSTHNNISINGISGSALVSGSTVYKRNVDCGYDCIRSSSDIDITISFSNYRIMPHSNCESTISRTVTFSEHSWSRQSGLKYSSSTSISVAGNNVAIKQICDDSWGYSDVASFNASGSSFYKLSGWCTPKNGNKYSF